jgi:hypothetical protein
MSLSVLRDSIQRKLQERADAATSRAINMRVRPGSADIPAMSCEEYALTQVDSLTEARVYMMAMQIVTDEYRRMTEPEKAADQNPTPPIITKSLY